VILLAQKTKKKCVIYLLTDGLGTPCLFSFIYLGETFSPEQIGGALLTLVAIYMVNYKSIVGEK
jgi:drug/metabolite transporter (DMT)-like permease